MQLKYPVIIIVALVIIVGYQTLTPTPTQEPTGTLQETKVPTETLAPTKTPVFGVREISVVGTEFSFNPASISVKAGEKVKIIFKNNGGTSHNLIVEGLNVGTKTIGGGQQDTIEFTVPSSGTYTFFCSIPGHRASGMEGSLKAE